MDNIEQIIRILDWFQYHSKNLTLAQERKLSELRELIQGD